MTREQGEALIRWVELAIEAAVPSSGSGAYRKAQQAKELFLALLPRTKEPPCP